jgi:hypothetical protein
MADITPSLRAAGVVTFASAGVCPWGLALAKIRPDAPEPEDRPWPCGQALTVGAAGSRMPAFPSISPRVTCRSDPAGGSR